jgi:DnaA-homolog protein
MKNNIPNQLTLGVGLKDEATFANFYAGRNHLVVTMLKAAAKAQGERVIYFYGTGGDGRTHLLQACCHEAHQHHLRTVYLPLNELIGLSPPIFDGLESLDLICVDDIHQIAGRFEWEEAFFHAYNRIRDAGKYLIVTANAPPKALNFSLQDVISRLVWGIGYELQPLTDEEKLQVLIMRADRRGMTLFEEVGKYILSHCPRHMTTLFAALETLDKASLAAQRKLTLPFVKSILKI